MWEGGWGCSAAAKGKGKGEISQERGEWGQGEKKRERESIVGIEGTRTGAKLVNWVRFDTARSQSNSIGQLKCSAVDPTIGWGKGFRKDPKLPFLLVQ